MMKKGTELIADERERQIDEERYSLRHDREVNKTGQLVWAAVAYAAPGRVYRRFGINETFTFKDPFPWDIQYDARHRCEKADRGSLPESDEYTKAERIRLLVKAGALIAAEIDRLNKWKP